MAALTLVDVFFAVGILIFALALCIIVFSPRPGTMKPFKVKVGEVKDVDG